MTIKYNVIVQKEEKWYVAKCLDNNVASQGKTIEEALNNLKMNGSKADKESTEVASEFIEIINNIINLEGLVIEIVGSWVWITGNTKEHKEVLKANGFYYASKKKAWYLKPNDYVAKSRKHYSLDEIKSKYGSTKVEAGTKKNYKKLA